MSSDTVERVDQVDVAVVGLARVAERHAADRRRHEPAPCVVCAVISPGCSAPSAVIGLNVDPVGYTPVGRPIEERAELA